MTTLERVANIRYEALKLNINIKFVKVNKEEVKLILNKFNTRISSHSMYLTFDKELLRIEAGDWSAAIKTINSMELFGLNLKCDFE